MLESCSRILDPTLSNKITDTRCYRLQLHGHLTGGEGNCHNAEPWWCMESRARRIEVDARLVWPSGLAPFICKGKYGKISKFVRFRSANIFETYEKEAGEKPASKLSFGILNCPKA